MKSKFFINVLICLWVVFKSTLLARADLIDTWIVWNIGQGQWVTHVTTAQCRHYDMGGEFGTLPRIEKKLRALCFTRPNQIVLSHWDFDHDLNIVPFVKRFPQVCWLSQPAIFDDKKSMHILLNLHLPACEEQGELERHVNFWKPTSFDSSNESSGVFQEQNFLVPGDSTIKAEKTWVRTLPGLPQVKILVLGHHGSRTSTGEFLLEHLPHLQMAISSARYAKYRHPNVFTLARLRKFHVPVLKTEDWGNLIFSN